MKVETAMQVRTRDPQGPAEAGSRRAVIRRRCTAAGVVATLTSALALATVATAATSANATPVATAVFSANATSSTLAGSLTITGLGTGTIAVTPTSASLTNTSSSATGANLTTSITPAILPALVINSKTVTAPPPTTSTETLINVPAAPLLTATGLSRTVTANYPTANGVCPSTTTPTSLASVTSATAAVGGTPPLPSLVKTGDAISKSTTALVSAAGPAGTDTRGVQAQASNTISRIDLFGGASALNPGGITLLVNAPSVLTGTATGVVGTSSVTFTAGDVSLLIGASTTPQILPRDGSSFALPASLAPLGISGSITLNPFTSTNTGTSVTGDAALLSLALTLRNPATQAVIVSGTLDVAKLHVQATSPATGIQCATAPTPPPPGIVPPVIITPGNGDHTTPTPPITGTGTPGDTVTVTEGGVVICTAVVDATGHWACTPLSALACGSHTISAVQKSPSGLVSRPSNTVTFTVDCPGPPLAVTGPHTGGLLGLGVLLITLGGLMLVATRRRQTA
ncbi:MAG: Ig-like domain-containing protein [Jatrophihabitantaceae bacterium]